MVFNSGRAKWVDNMRAGTRGPRLAVADGPSQGTWAGSAPVAETDPYEESIRKQLMAQQLRSAELQNQAADQQLSSQWEAERAQMFHPYDNMPMDRMALDKHSPLYQNEGDPQIQMDMEPSAGAWGASAPGMASPMAPERFDMPVPERERVPQSQWDAAFSKTNLNRWNDTELSDTPESRMKRASIEAWTRELQSVTDPKNPFSLSEDGKARAAQLRAAIDGATGIGGATAPANSRPDALGMLRDVPGLGSLIGLGERMMKGPVMYSEGGVSLSPSAPTNRGLSVEVGAPAGAVPGPTPRATGGNWWDSVPDSDKARYQQAANSGDRDTMAAIRKQYGAP